MALHVHLPLFVCIVPMHSTDNRHGNITLFSQSLSKHVPVTIKPKGNMRDKRERLDIPGEQADLKLAAATAAAPPLWHTQLHERGKHHDSSPHHHYCWLFKRLLVEIRS